MSINCKIALIVAMVAMVIPTFCAAKGITIETEAFVAQNNTGGQMVRSLALSGCSNGYALIGLDAAGEWAEYDAAVENFGHYTFLMKCRGDSGVEYGFQLVFTLGSGAEETVDFSFVGLGYG
jgi:hypothetical protein